MFLAGRPALECTSVTGALKRLLLREISQFQVNAGGLPRTTDFVLCNRKYARSRCLCEASVQSSARIDLVSNRKPVSVGLSIVSQSMSRNASSTAGVADGLMSAPLPYEKTNMTSALSCLAFDVDVPSVAGVDVDFHGGPTAAILWGV